RVSLIATEEHAGDWQTVGRVTYIGDAEKLDVNDIDPVNRYYNFFPQSRDYHKTHDFNFYIIKPVRIRFIGGFGQIHWIEKQDFIKINPFDFETEKQMLDHMNTDHTEAIKHYCELNTINYAETLTPEMIGVDSEGFNLRIGERIYRINFEKPVTNTGEVRKALVDMAKQTINE
ncbi:MAG: DUF2470 domain-containing protein, partial [Proteobacteria bacterium]|nr:DUF2470 domain-containing protein [Pseudomonadota bacterium]